MSIRFSLPVVVVGFNHRVTRAPRHRPGRGFPLALPDDSEIRLKD
jgi:hypothetical protein